MKQFMTNIKTLAALLMAGAAFIACSSSDDITTEIPQPVNPTGKYTMTIQATKGSDATTRALSLSGSTLKATWNEGEEVLVYQNGSKIGTLTAAASDDEETTLSGTLDSAPDASKDLTFHFHTAANPSYSGQDGTLTKIASSYDFCAPATVASGDFTVSGSTVEVSGGISFGANKQAIVKFTFLDKADVTNNSKLSPSTITASLDVSPSAPEPYKTLIQTGAAAAHMTLPYESTITIPDATYDENGIGIIYLAIPDKLSGALSGFKEYFDFTLTATFGDDVYTLTKSGFPFENGKYYEITAKMLATLTISGHKFYYSPGETWGNAINYHSSDNTGWSLEEKADGYTYVVYGGQYVYAEDVIYDYDYIYPAYNYYLADPPTAQTLVIGSHTLYYADGESTWFQAFSGTYGNENAQEGWTYLYDGVYEFVLCGNAKLKYKSGGYVDVDDTFYPDPNLYEFE